VGQNKRFDIAGRKQLTENKKKGEGSVKNGKYFRMAEKGQHERKTGGVVEEYSVREEGEEQIRQKEKKRGD